MGTGVGLDEFDGVFKAGEAEGFAGQGDLGGEDFVGAEAAVFLLAGEGEPHGGVAGGGADFDMKAGGRGGEEGDELAGLGGDLAEAFLTPTKRRMASMPTPVPALTMATGELRVWASERGSR